MKIHPYSLVAVLALFAFSSCNQGEGPGGTKSIEGYVFQVRYPDDNFSFKSDTLPFAEARVYLSYGDNKDLPADDDLRVSPEGYYRFDNLRSGDYAVYAYAELADKQLVAGVTKLSLNSSMTTADTIFVSSGKHNGMAIITGTVLVDYWKDGDRVSHNGERTFPAVDYRVSCKNVGEGGVVNDTRTDSNGDFALAVQPGRTYEVYVVGDASNTEDTKNLEKAVLQTITVPADGKHKVYPFDDDFKIVINL